MGAYAAVFLLALLALYFLLPARFREGRNLLLLVFSLFFYACGGFSALPLILLLPQRLTGQANNANRINYYRMFFTDGTVAALFSVGDRPYRTHERDLFAAMKLPFLDFFLEDVCRSVDAILSSDLKAYGRMVEGRPMEPPGQPLPNDVYLEYLNAKEEAGVKSASAISNQRAAYYKFLKENLC